MSEVVSPRLRHRVTARPSGESKVDQTQRGETDINNIVAQVRATGSTPHVNRRTPLYGDFSDAADLQTQIDRVRAAQDAFDALPARVRAAADNDPVLFLDMLEDPEGVEELESAGLVLSDAEPEATPDPAPDPVPAEPDPPAA